MLDRLDSSAAATLDGDQPGHRLPIVGEVEQVGDSSGFSEAWVEPRLEFQVRPYASVCEIVIRGWRPEDWGTEIPVTLSVDGTPLASERIRGPWFECRLGVDLPANVVATLSLDSSAVVRPCDISDSPDGRALLFELQQIEFVPCEDPLPIVGPVAQLGAVTGMSEEWIGPALEFRVHPHLRVCGIVIRGWRPEDWGTEFPVTLSVDGTLLASERIRGPWFEWRLGVDLPANVVASLSLDSPAVVRPCEVSDSTDERSLVFQLEQIEFEPNAEAAQSVNQVPGAQFQFMCNICGTVGKASLAELRRETPSCEVCFSTPRFRSVIHALSCELFGESLAIDHFPQRFDLRGIGLSDWDAYADRLGTRLSYTNTFLHQEPFLDIVSGAQELEGTLDFIISSEVFEHIDPPVSRAFDTALRLLKPGGRLILSTPYGDGDRSDEHFPTLHEYEIEGEGEHMRLRNVRADGTVEFFEDLVFHGGPGVTLEMRFFARRALMLDMLSAGFDTLTFYGPVRSRGIFWEKSDWGLPIVARAPAR